MVATHSLAMNFARRLNHVENIPQQDSASNAYTKLLRTFAAQMQSLKQYRPCGQQTVVVQRVDVRDCGQAIVGNVSDTPAGGRGDETNGEQPHALAYTRGSQVLCEVQEERRTVQRPCDPGESVCRMHGGKSPGAPEGRANGNYRTGVWTAEWRSLKRK